MLEASGVVVSFEGTVVLDGFDIAVDSGEIVAVLGASGCGKSTLLRYIAGLERGDAGSVMIDGVDVTPLRPEQRGVGLVFQNLALFPHLTVEKNLAFGMAVTDAEAIETMLETVGLSGFNRREISTLSGGEAQRVALARALLAAPSVLLLDEPFASLDEDLKLSLAAEVKEILKQRKTTTIHVTHDRQVAELISDRVITIE